MPTASNDVEVKFQSAVALVRSLPQKGKDMTLLIIGEHIAKMKIKFKMIIVAILVLRFLQKNAFVLNDFTLAEELIIQEKNSSIASNNGQYGKKRSSVQGTCTESLASIVCYCF